jgi:hypothetical protein
MPAIYSSTFRQFSKAKATENIPFGESVGEFTLSELLPAQDKEITSRYDEHEVTGKDASGISYAAKTKTSITISASWLPNSSNRLTAPNLRRGEEVMIWATADHGEYRWTPLGDDDDLRNTEVVLFGFRAAKDYKTKHSRSETMYVLEINGERGFVAFSTTVDRGEYTRTCMVWDLMKGTWTYEDGVDNKILVDAPEGKIMASNRWDSQFGIHESRAWFKAVDRVSVDAPYTQFHGSINVNGVVIADGFAGPPSNPWIEPSK